MRIKISAILFFMLLLSSISHSQSFENFVKGTIIDSENGQPLQDVNVFFSGTTVGTASDSSGNFIIRSIHPAQIDLVVSIIGYETETELLQISSTSKLKVNFKLKRVAYKLEDINVISEFPDKWEENLAKFKRLFLGNTRFTDDCIITNQNYIEFSHPKKDLFVASSRVPLHIINNALGYEIYCTMQNFRFDEVSMHLDYTFSPQFIIMKSKDQDSVKTWKENREIAYRNSIEYLMKCLFDKTFTDKGFKITTSKIANTKGLRAYRQRVWDSDRLLKPYSSHQKILSFENFLQVENSRSDYNIETTSWIRLKGRETIIDENGQSQDLNPYENYGFWANAGVANSIPRYYSFTMGDK